MKTLAYKILYIHFILFFISNSLFGQLVQKVIPPSPNVASLGKYGSIPISLYTGIPNINIPIYNIQSGSLELPISLSYHAGGVKVEEVASPVGLGWSLNAGGVIGRSIRGIADEFGWYPQSSTNTIEYIMQHGTTAQQNQLVVDVKAGTKDGEADLYYYNFAGHSGKFFLDQITGEGHSIPLKNIRIHRNPHWEIVDEDGTIYTFAKEETVGSSYCAVNDDAINTTAWYLTSMKSSDGKSEITFTYEPSNYVFQSLVGETKYISIDGSSGCMENESCVGTHAYNSQRLLRIDFRNGYLKFNYNNVRCDLVDDKSLDEIEIFKSDGTSNGTLIRTFLLDYDYFGNNSDGCNRFTEINKRLKLLSITETTLQESKPPYSFYYNEVIPLPSRLSYAQDHWGYFNGKINNPGLVATFVNTSIAGAPIIEKGADRRTDPAKAQAAILTKIVYPTGGETLFTFESNTVSDDHVEPQTYDQSLFLGASNYPVHNLPAPYESATQLVIPASGAVVQFIVSGLDSELWPNCDIVQCYVIKDNNPTPFRQVASSLNQAFEPWPAGTYKLRLITDCNIDAIANFSVNIVATIPVMEMLDTRPVGGLRIFQIEDKPVSGAPSVIKTYRYNQENEPNKSSGILINFPDYGYDLHVHRKVKDYCDPPGGPIVKDIHCQYRVRKSFSNYPLATTEGSFVGYANVYEDLGTGGESWYEFHVYADISPAFPFAPVENFNWRRGLMLSRTDYIRQSGQLIKVKEVLNLPTSTGSEFRIYGLKSGCTYLYLYNCMYQDGEYFDPCLSSVENFYPSITEPYYIGQTREILYDPGDEAKFVEKIINYSYSAQHLQLQQIKTVTSRSDAAIKEEVVTQKKYPLDYSFSGSPVGNEALGIKKLQDLHVVNTVIEEYVVKQNRNTSNQLSNQRVISGLLTTFKPTNPYPDQVFQLEINQPVLLENFGNSSGISNNSFTKTSLYKPAVAFVTYDDKGNLVTQQKTNDLFTSYIWGYNKSYPIAEAMNVSSTNDIAYTSFEEDGKGNWPYNGSPTQDYYYTGTNSYLVTGNSITKSLLTASTTYILSYWFKDGASISVAGGTQTEITTTPGANGWTLSTRKISGTTSITISGTGYLDELRLCPINSQMTTYTFDPLVGITTKTDVNNMITFFYHDSMGRLSAIRDAKRNVLKTYTYHYKGQ